MKPGPRRQQRCGDAYRRATHLALAALLLSGCTTTQVPLQPDHGYPADWPRLMPLSEGFTELNGVYANTGVATGDNGELVPIKLADLVPRTQRRKGASPRPESGCEDCVALQVFPADGGLVPSNRLRFTVPDGSERRVFDVDATGNANVAFYPLTGSAQSAYVAVALSGSDVRLTCAEDGSLVAQVHSMSSWALFMVIPIDTQNDYVWARFERIREVDAPPATTPPADR